MNVWGWTFVISNALYWALFLRQVRRGPRRPLPIVIGVVHMLFATVVSVAPVRSFFESHYAGFAIGLLRFEGRTATVPSLVILVCSLACAYFVVSRSVGRGLLLVAVFDFLFAVNTAAGILASNDHRIQFGNALTIDGLVAIAIMLIFFAGAPLLSSGWAWRHQVDAA
jgi:hypothetical protein